MMEMLDGKPWISFSLGTSCYSSASWRLHRFDNLDDERTTIGSDIMAC
jgi:hypothetical protein